MVENNICEAIILFFIGCAGSMVFLSLNVLFGNEFSYLNHDSIHRKFMIPIFIITGGFITTIYSLTLQQSLVPSTIWKYLLIGIGWQGLVHSFITIRDVKEGIRSPHLRGQIQRLQRVNRALQENNRRFIDGNLNQNT